MVTSLIPIRERVFSPRKFPAMWYLCPPMLNVILLCVYIMPSSGIQTEEMKVKKSIKDAAKRGQVDVAKILAKEVVQSKKAVSKLYASKAQMNSVVMSMQQQLGQ